MRTNRSGKYRRAGYETKDQEGGPRMFYVGMIRCALSDLQLLNIAPRDRASAREWLSGVGGGPLSLENICGQLDIDPQRVAAAVRRLG